jgi:hypothetical protein
MRRSPFIGAILICTLVLLGSLQAVSPPARANLPSVAAGASAAPAAPAVPQAVAEANRDPAPAKGAPDRGVPGAAPARPTAPDLITAGTYSFTSGTGVALQDMSSGTTQLVGAGQDDTASALTNIGFDFWYDGVRVSQFSANANGLMRLGSTVIDTAYSNSLAGTTDAPKIAPFWDDLCTGTNGKVHYKVSGSAPNRTLVVEWLNMQITRGSGCGSAGTGTFQVWLSETTGAIQVVYGAIPAATADGGYSVGLQAGTATNFASVTTAGPTVSYAAANNTQTTAIAAGTAYSFTPNTPVAPTDLSFSGVSAVGMTLNWTDNATNEVGYAVYQSTDGATYAFAGQTAANATAYAASGLAPSTTYFWRVAAVTEGAVSGALAGSQATQAPGNIVSTATGGPWSAPATWAGGVVPTGGDVVTIATGATVVIDTAAAAYSLTVDNGALLQYEATTARTLTVAGSVTIAAGGTFASAATGTVTSHALVAGGDLTNNGTLDFSTNGDTAGAGITFTGAAGNTFGGTGATTDIRALTINKGTAYTSVLELNPANFTVRGVPTDVAGFLTLTNGTLKISGTFAMTNRVFPSATYAIPATAGIWLNNPNFTVAGQAGGSTSANNGLLRLTQGTYNVGVGAGDGIGGGAGAVFTIEGGTLNATGRVSPQGATTYTQSGGTVNVATVGNSLSNYGAFELFSSGSFFQMSGGTINLVKPSTGATKVDYRVNSATANTSITGGQVVAGAAGAPAGSIYNVVGQMPSTTVNAGMTMRVNNGVVFMRGTSVTNNGVIDFTGASARYDFGSLSGPMTYSGSGTLGTAAAPFGGVGISANSLFLVTLNAPIVCFRTNLFQGGFVNSNQITLGNGGTSTTVVQIGSTGLTTPGGSFDVSPVHSQGTGGEIVLYAYETAPRTTGVEINPTRILASINVVDNPNGVTLDDNLMLNSTAAALVLTSGRLITGPYMLYLASGSATVTRTAGWVDGNLGKHFAAAANKTFEVGTANGYSPVAFNATAGTFPADVTVRAVEGTMPGLVDAGRSLQRYWAITAADLTADLTFNYLDPTDIPATADETSFVLFMNNGTLSEPGGTVNPASNQATITGATGLTANWSLAEPIAAATFTPTPTGVPTNTPTATHTATPTDTPVPPSHTPTPTQTTVPPSHTPTPTGTAGVPTSTPTGTPVAATPTSTTLVPTNTPTATPAAPTSTPGLTPTVAPSPTGAATQTPATTPTVLPCTITFSDVVPANYFYEPVRYLYCRGVISGYADNTFRPYNNTTRAQMVKIVVLGFGIPDQVPSGEAHTFADVLPAHPFYRYIETAAARGIVSGYNCGPGGPGPCDDQNRPYFAPNNPVTRGQLSKIDAVAAGWPLLNPPSATFSDVPRESPFYTYIETAVCRGVVSGYDDHTFRPANNATRGQISKIVYLSITAGPGTCGAARNP